MEPRGAIERGVMIAGAGVAAAAGTAREPGAPTTAAAVAPAS
ncbi:MAG: hypothetical protein JWM85_3631 [Acidimicrobiaceae bacterium]|nr:hypothetical protein [Acidimicrobiaceae bacterium]